MLAVWFVTRLALFIAFKPAGASATDVVLVFLGGLHRDFFAALMETIPLLCWMLIVPDRCFGALWHRLLFLGGCVVFWFLHSFMLFTVFFFLRFL